jgi:hypothetical protein
MTNAKAIINLKEGTIQLEGPESFVREYLEKYSPPAKKQPKHITRRTPEFEPTRLKIVRVPLRKDFVVNAGPVKVKPVKETPVKEKPIRQKKIKPLKILTRGKRGRNSLARIMNAEIESGFFDRPVSVRDIDNQLAEKGIGGSMAMIKGALKRAIADGKIEMMGKGRGVVYMRKIKVEVTPPTE